MELFKEEIHKELDLVQTIITRMASNSFEVKKWLIGILTAIVVFKQEELLGGHGRLMWILLVPIAAFWYLDAFFLSTEKLYREMYKWIIANRPLTDKYLYDLNTMQREYPDGTTTNFVQPKNSVWRVAFSKTLWPFYLVPVLFVLIYMGSRLFSC
jgi:hypothetical protein